MPQHSENALDYKRASLQTAIIDFARTRLRSFRYAAAGIGHLVRSQKNAWLHCVATVVVLAAATALRLDAGEWCWIIAAILAVWSAEAFNTAVELLCDAACPEFHPLVGKAKDVAAGAVLIAACGAAGIGACVLGPHLWGLFCQ